MKIPAFRDSGVSAVFLQKADIFPVPGHLQKLPKPCLKNPKP
jgi:hypothetical protein